MPRAKPEIITFKVDPSLAQTLRAISNRSEFIRAALLAALENVCPLCQGSGLLSADQRKHWEIFSQDHALQECDSCQEVHLVCARQGASRAPRRVHRVKK
jgi:hypothetical protein